MDCTVRYENQYSTSHKKIKEYGEIACCFSSRMPLCFLALFEKNREGGMLCVSSVDAPFVPSNLSQPCEPRLIMARAQDGSGFHFGNWHRQPRTSWRLHCTRDAQIQPAHLFRSESARRYYPPPAALMRAALPCPVHAGEILLFPPSVKGTGSTPSGCAAPHLVLALSVGVGASKQSDLSLATELQLGLGLGLPNSKNARM
jgi:hypothetical protein